MAFDMASGGVMTVADGGGGNRSLSLASMMAQMELAQQVAMAKGDPRDEDRCLIALNKNVLASVAAAEECTYMLSRRGKDDDDSNDIIGPTIRFAESVARSWKNCRYSAEVVEINDKFVVAEGRFFDLEAVTSVCRQVRRRITYRNGKTYNDDMIQVTSNAACSIALRDAILYGGVPSGFWRPVHDACMAKVRRETTGNLEAVITKMLLAYTEIGVTEGTLLNYIGRGSRSKMLVADVVRLRQIWQAIHDGTDSAKEVFSGFGMVAATTATTNGTAKASSNGKEKAAQTQQQKDAPVTKVAEVSQESTGTAAGGEAVAAEASESAKEPEAAGEAVATSETVVKDEKPEVAKTESKPASSGKAIVQAVMKGTVKDAEAQSQLALLAEDPVAAWAYRVLGTEGIEPLKIRGRELTELVQSGSVSEADAKAVRALVSRQMSMG